MMLPTQTRELMVRTGMPWWQRLLLHAAYAVAMGAFFVWTLLVLVICWPVALVASWRTRKE